MSRILFSVFSNIDTLKKGGIDAFFQNFIDALLENGNEVYLLRVNDLPFWPKEDKIDEYDLLNKIRDFNPEVIISPNHEIPLCILQKTSCKIVAYTADSPTYLKHKEYIKKNKERYTFIHGGWENIFPQILKDTYGILDNQNYYIGHMTNVKAKEMEIKRNIGFIGFIGWPMIAIYKLLESKKQDEFLQKIAKFEEQGISCADYNQIRTSNIRIKTLDAIHDLGLEAFGIPRNFIPVGVASWELMKCFNFQSVTTTQETEDILNSSLISPNLYNYQAPNGLSWRVADVMASNAVLISPPKPDLKHLSPYIDIPTYETPAECRELCQKLLKDSVWRKEIVEGSQKAINEICRPISTLEIISEAIGIPLVLKDNQKCKSNLVRITAGIKLKGDNSLKRRVLSFRYKIIYKLWKHIKKEFERKLKKATFLTKSSFLDRCKYRTYKHLAKKLSRKEIITRDTLFEEHCREYIEDTYASKRLERLISSVKDNPIVVKVPGKIVKDGLIQVAALSVPYIKPENTFKKLICVSGFGFSGSGAVSDFFAEFKDTTVLSYADPDGSLRENTNKNMQEIDIFRHMGGLFSLEQAFQTRNPFIRDGSIKTFIALVEYSYACKKGIYNNEFLRLSRDFIEELILFKLPTAGGFELEPHMESKGVHYPAYANLDFPMVRHPNKIRYIYSLKDLTVEQYRNLVKKYFSKILNTIESNDILVMDQIVGDLCCDIERYQAYLGKLKLISVYRDPRDVYATVILKRISWIPNNIDDFIAWYKYSTDAYKKCKHSDFLFVRFEDLVLKYGETTNKIYDFVELSSDNHITSKSAFSPEVSIKNIGLYKQLGNQTAILEIEKQLGEFCYYPEEEKVSEEILAILNKEV